MGKNTQRYNPVALFMEGLLSFGKSAMFAGWSKPTYTRLQQMKRRKSHAKFKAQRIARRQQRQLSS